MTKFNDLTFKELEKVLHDSVQNVDIKSIDRFEVRCKMFTHLQETFSDRIINFYDRGAAPITFDEVNVASHKSDYSELTVTANGIRMDFKIGVKGTKEYEEVSKTRKKEYVVPNKITFSGARKSLTYHVYRHNAETRVAEFDKDCWSSGGVELAWGKSTKVKIGDLLSKEHIGESVSIEDIYDNYYGAIRSEYFNRTWIDGKRKTPYKVEPVLYELESITNLIPDHWNIESYIDDEFGAVVTSDAINAVVRKNVVIDYKDAADKHIAKELNWEK